MVRVIAGYPRRDRPPKRIAVRVSLMFSCAMENRDDAWERGRLTCLFHCALYHWNIRLTCHACRHERVFQGHQLWWLFERRGWDDRMPAVPPRCRCSACWDVRKVRVVNPDLQRTREAPTGPALPWPDERAWKRHVSRYRS